MSSVSKSLALDEKVDVVHCINTAIDFNFRRHNNMQPLDLSFQQTND